MPKSKRGKRTKQKKKPVPRVKYTVRDSVFSYLFHLPEYMRELYLTLHPEDTDVKEKDCSAFTLENVLTNGQYNDLGIMVRDRLLILVEAQTTFSVNIILRLLLYLAETYRRYVDAQNWDLYSSHAVTLPRPEMVVIYTGDRKNVPEVLHLSDLFEEEGSSSVEMTVPVLRWRGTNDIIDQYVRFSQITTEMEKKYGRTQEAIDAIFKACMAEGILVPFLRSREKEVRNIMITLFDERRIQELHDNTVREEGRKEGRREGHEEGRREGHEEGRREGHEEGRREGRKEGRKEGREESSVDVVREMLRGNEPVSKIAKYTQVSVEKIAEIARSIGIRAAI